MKSQISELNNENRVYFNKYEPIIYTRIVTDHIELTVRYLMHPKKARYVESVIWNKIYVAYRERKIDLFTGAVEPTYIFENENDLENTTIDNHK